LVERTRRLTTLHSHESALDIYKPENLPLNHFSSPYKLSLATVYIRVRAALEDLLPLQIQDPSSPDMGGLWSPGYGMADPKLTGQFVTLVAYTVLAAERLGDGSLPRTDLLDRAVSAADYLLTAQHESGLIDLLSVNYDSAPDTAFTVQALCTIFEVGREQLAAEESGALLLARLETFIRRTLPGIATGGFHTPNHRWVMASAMLQARAIFPDLATDEALASAATSYLAEGMDMDAEGMFIERSVGVYDAVNDRSWLFIAQYGDKLLDETGTTTDEVVSEIGRNLTLNLHLLHADGTAETGLSRRQDYGTREVPIGLIDSYLVANHLKPTPVFAAAAQALWRENAQGLENPGWVCYSLLRCGDPHPKPEVKLPDDFATFLPFNGVHRVRRGLLSSSFFQRATRLATVTFGQAELTAIKFSQTYFGQYIGRFQADEMHFTDERLTMISRGQANPRRPGYEMPLGRPIPHEEWHAALAERELRRLPHAVSELVMEEGSDEWGQGFDLHLRTLEGTAGVTAQMAFDFPPGGIWETNDTRLQPQAGQVIFLQQGYGSMRYGNDVLRLGPGTVAHGTWAMREAEPAPEHVRVLVPFLLPVDYTFSLRGYRGLVRHGMAGQV
jgi:hypothetical protein